MVSVIAGGLIAAGLCVIVWTVVWKPSILPARVIPHIGTRSQVRRSSPARGWLARQWSRLNDALGSTSASVTRRQGIIGSGTIREFRLAQTYHAGAGLIAGIVFGIVLTVRGSPVVTIALTAALGVVVGAVFADRSLTARSQRANDDMTRELPDVVELLALSVGSGEPIRVAIESLAARGQGTLMAQLAVTVSDMNAGSTVSEALDALARRSANTQVARFCETVIAALDTGGGLAESLHAQARDARDASRRLLIERGGKAEVSMMVPVVFLILPITVMFTLFPALSTLTLL